MLTTKYLILYWKTLIRFPENLEYAEMRHGDVIVTYIDFTDRRAAVRFLSFPQAGTGMWDRMIELSHMGKNNENPDLECKKNHA